MRKSLTCKCCSSTAALSFSSSAARRVLLLLKVHRRRRHCQRRCAAIPIAAKDKRLTPTCSVLQDGEKEKGYKVTMIQRGEIKRSLKQRGITIASWSCNYYQQVALQLLHGRVIINVFEHVTTALSL